MNALENIFTSKVVGALFAIAFGSWAFVLRSLGNQWIDEQKSVRLEIAQIKTEMSEHRLYAAETGTQFGERQQMILRWLESHEKLHSQERAEDHR